MNHFFIAAFIVVTTLSSVASAENVPVFLVGGQSNAKQVWAESIEATLRETYNEQTVVVSSFHSGNWLFRWHFQGEPGPNYVEDSNAINEAFEAIIAAGDTPVLEGVFWFQGEGDTGWDVAIRAYAERFQDMINQYESDFQTELLTTIMVIDADPNFSLDVNRTRETVEDLRTVQFGIGNRRDSTAVDTRGFQRGDIWHLPDSELERLGEEAASAFVSLASSASEVIEGDVNQDGAVNFSDVRPFIAVLASYSFLDEADCNQDAVVDFRDVSWFIGILAAQN